MGRAEHAVNRKGWDYHSVRSGFLTLAIYLVLIPMGRAGATVAVSPGRKAIMR